MKSQIKTQVFFFFAFTALAGFTGCGAKKSNQPVSVSVPPQPTALNPSGASNQERELEEKQQQKVMQIYNRFQLARNFLLAMGCEINGKDIAVLAEPTNYKQGKDLKLALDLYRDAAYEMANLAANSELKPLQSQSQNIEITSSDWGSKTFWREVWESAAALSSHYLLVLQKFYLDDLERIAVAEGRLKAFGFRFKKINNDWVLAHDKDFGYYYSHSTLKSELSKYIETISSFLWNYGDGQSHLDFQTKMLLEKKLSLAKDLTETLLTRRQ